MKRLILITLFLLPLLTSCGVVKLFNAGSVNLKYTASQAKFNNQLYENKDHIKNVSFSIRNAQHPKAFGKWNLNLRLSPSINLDRADYQTGATFINQAGAYERYRDVQYRRLATVANLKLTFHTPIGAFSAAGGAGLGAFTLDDQAGLGTKRTGLITRLDAAWTIFISKHFFVLFGTRLYKEDGNEFRQAAIRLGYFWGNKSK